MDDNHAAKVHDKGVGALGVDHVRRGEPAADTTGVLCLDWPGPWSEGGWQRAKASLPRLLVQLALES